MNYKKFVVKTTSHFEQEAKRLIKKYSSLKEEIREFSKLLEKKPETGSPLGNNIFKVRVAIVSKGKGKRGGARIITYFAVNDETVWLLSIYDKGENDTISNKKIKEILNETLLKLQIK